MQIPRVHSRSLSALLATLFLVLSACGGDDSPNTDAGTRPPDASIPDSGGDAGPPDGGEDSGTPGNEEDSGTHTGTDGGPGPQPEQDAGPTPETDAGPTPGTDAGPTPQTDAGPVPETDAGPTPEPDAGPLDGGPAPEPDAGPLDGGPAPEPDAGPLDGGPAPEPDAGMSTCGDGHRQLSEACDDGNTVSGDGCSASCAEVEPGWVCEQAGQPCVLLPVCGDGQVDGQEVCDDGNTTSNDGCDTSCAVETGWSCPANGGACGAAACGDGILAGQEECEDGNTTSADGCNGSCRLESGYKCPIVGQPCSRTTCGDQVTEGTEQCDDGNNDTGDGCSPLCMREPLCTNGVCESVCGDGVLLPNDTTEECDDGNTRAHDGCSSSCELEPGFQCVITIESPPAQVALPIVYRDFRGYDLPASSSLPRGHIDFENKNGAETGIVKNTLDANGKPAYAKEGQSSLTTHGAAAFAQWFRDTAFVNKPEVGTLILHRQPNGSYIFDNQSFFPLDNLGWVASGQEPLRGDNGNPARPRNFSFTSETRYWFEYKGTEVLDFRGDDDVWVFINRILALDMGGVHGAMSGNVSLSNQATRLGLTPGGIYEVAVFQAERHTTASSYRLTLHDFTTRHTECSALCGNFIVDEGEQCDDGTNNGGYGECAPGCVLGPRCGDHVVQFTSGEECDDGNGQNNDGCSATCKIEIH
ncbi:DUF4215 domain-containing protein [Myxococcus sp. CA033]|nr:DUF4215 domain-containing protein [Myxococcus sp. CA033]